MTNWALHQIFIDLDQHLHKTFTISAKPAAAFVITTAIAVRRHYLVETPPAERLYHLYEK